MFATPIGPLLTRQWTRAGSGTWQPWLAWAHRSRASPPLSAIPCACATGGARLPFAKPLVHFKSSGRHPAREASGASCRTNHSVRTRSDRSSRTRQTRGICGDAHIPSCRVRRSSDASTPASTPAPAPAPTSPAGGLLLLPLRIRPCSCTAALPQTGAALGEVSRGPAAVSPACPAAPGRAIAAALRGGLARARCIAAPGRLRPGGQGPSHHHPASQTAGARRAAGAQSAGGWSYYCMCACACASAYVGAGACDYVCDCAFAPPSCRRRAVGGRSGTC